MGMLNLVSLTARLRDCLLFACAGLAAAQTPQFRAGVARVELTPTGSMPMYGYSNRRCGPSNGIHDPLFAKVLVLEAGESRMAIVTLDLGSIVSNNLRRGVSEKLGIPVLLLAASHTHSGPSYLAPAGTGAGLTPNATASAYLAEIESKIFSAVKEAAGSMFPARIGVGRGSIRLGYNRLLPRDDGRSRALFDNLERVPYGPLDPEYTLVRVEDDRGAVKALMVHYAVHAVVMGPTNCKFSADFPGVMQSRVEAEIPGAQCMFVQGGAGDINPLFQARKGNDTEDFATLQKMGDLLAADVLKTAKKMHAEAPAKPSIQSTSQVLTFADRWDKEKRLDVGITTVLLNGEIAIAAIPGEPHHKLQTMWKRQADVPHALFYGYTFSSGGMWPGYIPDLRNAAYGGYGADVTTRVEIGAGETIMQRHLINLYGLRGMWRDTQGKP